jgi:putative transposase
MIKRYKKFHVPTMRRSVRVFLPYLNIGKGKTLAKFLYRCHEIRQYFVDLFWQRHDFSNKLADLTTIHRACERFDISTRLSQCLAKQAKETIQSGRKIRNRKPRLRSHLVTLFSHFVTIESFQGISFDYAVRIGGAGVPIMTLPVHSTKVLNKFLQDNWTLAKTVRIGLKNSCIFIDLTIEKPRPPKKEIGNVVGMDSNYKNGFVFSDGQQVGQKQYETIRSFPKRKKHTHKQITDLVGHALKQIDFSQINILCIENLKYVKHKTRGTFRREHNRRLSHWLYTLIANRLSQYCEQFGVRLERKSPWKTSQYCRICGKWDRRNRKGDKFLCVNCGNEDHADFNAAKNLELLGLAGVYGLHSLQSSK